MKIDGYLNGDGLPVIEIEIESSSESRHLCGEEALPGRVIERPQGRSLESSSWIPSLKMRRYPYDICLPAPPSSDLGSPRTRTLFATILIVSIHLAGFIEFVSAVPASSSVVGKSGASRESGRPPNTRSHLQDSSLRFVRESDVENGDSRQKSSREVDVDEENDSVGDKFRSSEDTDPEFEKYRLADSQPEKKSAREAPSKQLEEFHGFPDDFMKGLKPFDFYDTSGSHRNSKSTGFVTFDVTGRDLPSLASSLGGLKPYPLNEANVASDKVPYSRDPEPGHTSSEMRQPITPNSFEGNNEEDRGGGDGGTYDDSDNKDVLGGRGDGNDNNVGRNANVQGELDDGDNPDGHSKTQSRYIPNEEPNNAKPMYSGGYAMERSSKELPEAEEVRTKRQHPTSRRFSRSLNEKAEATSTSSVARFVAEAKAVTSKKPNNEFRDSDQDHLSESQNLMPHFVNGPVHHMPPFGNYRLMETASHQGPQPPPVRRFRQTSHRPPFFIGPGQFHNVDEGFFPGGGEYGSGPTLVPTAHFDSMPQRFSQPEFRFPGERMRKLPHHRPPTIQLHAENSDNHHGASASKNILGSGNFGVIRGGLFADDENPEPSSITPFRPYHGGHNDDFFYGFRDFQPYGGGPMHNALSRTTNNIHRSQSKTAPVIVAFPSSDGSDSTTTVPSGSSNSTTTTTAADMDEQIMEEK